MQVLPLTDLDRRGNLGWCVSSVGLLDSPDVEVMCGGINTKTPRHAAVWRQGNLLHFGFEERPEELNDAGRDLLENAVHYIARFRDDRPILVTPSGFVERRYPRPRDWLEDRLADGTATAESLAARFAEPLRSAFGAMSDAEAREWLQARMGFVVCDDGRYSVDADAERLGVALEDPAFPASALAERALALLARRVPDGPGEGASADAWGAFLDANRAFLFFTETGGYAWRIDPLAKERGVPTLELRGSRRASD